VRVRQQVVAEPARFVEIAIAAQTGIDRGQAEDRSGCAADDVERRRIEVVAALGVDQPQRLPPQRWIVEMAIPTQPL
jgi:hypothetical protein